MRVETRKVGPETRLIASSRARAKERERARNRLHANAKTEMGATADREIENLAETRAKSDVGLKELVNENEIAPLLSQNVHAGRRGARTRPHEGFFFLTVARFWTR